MSNAAPSVSPSTRVALVASIAVASYFLAFDAADYLRDVTAEVYGRFWSVRGLLFVHIAAGSLALVAGAVQLCLAYLRRTSSTHRWFGRIYIGAVLVSCVASLAILRNGSVVGPIWVMLLVTLAASALLFTAFGLISARRRRWREHAAWMLRSYMAMMVFAWFRLGWELPVLQDVPAGTRAPTILGVAMLLTLAATELLLISRARDPQSPSPHDSVISHRDRK